MKFASESYLIYYLTFTSSFPAMHLGSELKIYNLAGKIVSLFNFELLLICLLTICNQLFLKTQEEWNIKTSNESNKQRWMK